MNFNLNKVTYPDYQNSKNVLSDSLVIKDVVCLISKHKDNYSIMLKSPFDFVAKGYLKQDNFQDADFKFEQNKFFIKTNKKYFFKTKKNQKLSLKIKSYIFHIDDKIISVNNSEYIDYFKHDENHIVGLSQSGLIFYIDGNWIKCKKENEIIDIQEDSSSTNFENKKINYVHSDLHYLCIENELFVYDNNMVLLNSFLFDSISAIKSIDVFKNRILVTTGDAVIEYLLKEQDYFLIEQHGLDSISSKYVKNDSSWIVYTNGTQVITYNLFSKKTKSYNYFNYDDTIIPFEFQYYNFNNISDVFAFSNKGNIDGIYMIENERRMTELDACAIVEYSVVEEDVVCL